MSVDTTVAVLYAQSGLSTNMANAAMVAPQAAVAMSRMLAAEAALQERERVEKNDKAEEAGIKGDGGKRGFFHSRRRGRSQREVEESETLATTAILGNLLNVKV